MIVGSVLSAGITLNVQVAVFPTLSVAVSVTVVVVVMSDPNPGLCVTATDRSQLSAAVASPV